MLIESRGQIALKTSSKNGGDIIAVYNGKELRIHYSITDERGEFTGQKWYLTYGQSTQPPSVTGWIPYAADKRGDIGVFLWKDTYLDSGNEFWEAIGFSLTTGEMVGQFLDDGTYENLERMRERFLSGNPASEDDVTYGSSQGSPDQSEISRVFTHFDDIINPGQAASEQTMRISRPEAFGKNSADIITNYDPKADGPIQIDLSSFEGASSRLKIAKKTKQAAKLAKKNTDFIYDQQAGYLYYNENGKQTGFGDGGIFAILEGKPKVGMGNFEFM